MAPGRHPNVRWNPPVNRLTNQNNMDINSGIDTQMLDQLIATRVAEALTAAAVTHAASTQEETNLGSNSSQNKACNYKEFRLVMHENFCGTEGAWNVYVRSVTLDTAHATPWSKFKGTNLTAYNQRFQELILLCPEMVPNTDRLLERYLEGLPLNIKGNLTSSKPVDLHEAIQMAQGLMYQEIRPKSAELYLVPQAKEDLEAKEDREIMLLVLDVVRRDITRTRVRTTEVKAVETKFEASNKILRTIRGRIKETLKEITKHQPALKEDAEHLAEYTAYVLKLL
ncbi:hypothetical protein Tco_0419104 [Tanacetum coccineum]